MARCSAFFSAESSPKVNTVGLFDGKLYAQRPWLPFLVDLLRHFWSRFYSAPAVNITRQANCRVAIFAAVSFSWRPR
jgi:hypothetical protein